MAECDNQDVTNAVILNEIKHLGQKIDDTAEMTVKRFDDHEERLRSVEQSSAVFRYAMGAWNALNSIGVALMTVLGK